MMLGEKKKDGAYLGSVGRSMGRGFDIRVFVEVFTCLGLLTSGDFFIFTLSFSGPFRDYFLFFGGFLSKSKHGSVGAAC